MASQVENTAATAWEVATKYEPKLAAALGEALGGWPDKVSASKIEAFVRSGDLAGLSSYLSAALGASAAGVVAVLDAAVNEAGIKAAADVNAHLAVHGRTVADQLPFPSDVPAAVVFQGVTPQFAYNPVNPKTVQAVRTWQGNLIQQMSESSRQSIMDTIRRGLIEGQNPRTVARWIRRDLSLTSSQNLAVVHFDNDLGRIVERGIRSAETWGIYTPRQIATLKLDDPSTYRRLNFTATEVSGGRRWGKISRAAGTLQFDPKAGIKASKPVGFVSPPGTQGGENAFRLTPDGKPVDAMMTWRLRDKRFDPKIYDVVAAEEQLQDARAALSGARTGPEADAAREALAKAEARHRAATDALQGERGRMVEQYRARMVKHRSQVIARTEAMRASNLGSYEAWRQTIEDSDLFEPDEVKRKWITAKDDRVRMDHRAAAGQEVAMREPFKVGGESVMFPPPSAELSVYGRLPDSIGRLDEWTRSGL